MNGYFCIAIIILCVRSQTNSPTNNPSEAPTPNYYALEYESCVIADSIGGGGMTVSLSRNVQYGLVLIEMKGPVDRWSGFGLLHVFVHA